MNVAVEVDRLTKTYGSGANAYRALRGVNLTVQCGEFLLLSGPSGSGKTTLLSIIGGVLAPTAGSVHLFGERLSTSTDLSHVRLAYIGFVFQGYNLISSLSAAENVMVLLRLRGEARTKARAEAEHVLELVGMREKADSKPRELSGGERQRVAIARALAAAPPIILADEPTAALDARNGLAATQLLRDLAKRRGHTVLVVTHDSRIFHLADRMVCIEDGLIAEEAV